MLSRAVSVSIVAAQRKRHLVKLKFFALSLLSCAAAATPAAAQMYPNDEVIVNPSATGSQVLLYPGGQYGRVSRPLLQPGEADPNAPIHLHMPYPHKIVHHVAKAKPKTDVAATKPAAQPEQTADQSSSQDMLSFGPVPGESAASLVTPSRIARSPAR